MAVDIQRGFHILMAQAFRDKQDLGTQGDQKGGVAVPQIVEPDLRCRTPTANASAATKDVLPFFLATIMNAS